MSRSDVLRIGALASATGTNPPTIRYYESIGLLPPAGRQDGGQRRYSAEDVSRLTFIRRCRAFGFSIDQVRALADLISSERCCTEVRDVAKSHLDDVRAKLTELRALERAVAEFVQRCDHECAGGPGSACVPLIEMSRAEKKRA